MDTSERLHWLASHARPLGTLTSEITGHSSVVAYLAGDDLWVGSHDYGCLRTDRATHEIEAFPVSDIGRDDFNDSFVAAWIPQIQQFWGRQVLHASSVIGPDDGRLIVFCGDKESGKSTLAYGLALRPGWQQLGDDMLVFEVSGDTIEFIHFPEEPRLRPTSANYFDTDLACVPATWPAKILKPGLIYTLIPSEHLEEPARISPVNGARAYKPLLQQAFNLTLVLPELKRSLIQDYAVLVNQTRVFQLEYRQQIDLIPQILDMVEEHTTKMLESEVESV